MVSCRAVFVPQCSIVHNRCRNSPKTNPKFCKRLTWRNPPRLWICTIKCESTNSRPKRLVSVLCCDVSYRSSNVIFWRADVQGLSKIWEFGTAHKQFLLVIQIYYGRKKDKIYTCSTRLWFMVNKSVVHVGPTGLPLPSFFHPWSNSKPPFTAVSIHILTKVRVNFMSWNQSSHPKFSLVDRRRCDPPFMCTSQPLQLLLRSNID